MPIVLVIRFLIADIYGVLLLSITLYLYCRFFGGVQPFTFSQIVLWVDGLSAETKTSLLAAILTILGFLFAFHTASANWKDEALSNLKLHVAMEIEEFFAEASRLTSDAEIYANTLVNAVNKIQGSRDQQDIEFSVQWAVQRLPHFLAARERLSSMGIEVYRISGKHFAVLATVPGAIKALEDCAASFGEITKSMWFRIPSIPVGHPDPVALFFSQINVSQCSEFVRCCKNNFGRVNGLSGGVRGALLAPIIGMRVGTWSSMRGKKAEFEAALQQVRKQPENGD